MDTQDIVATMIDKILAGENISAQEDFESLISDKMVTALEQKKQDIAQSLYAGNDVEELDLNLEDYSLEEIEDFMMSEDFDSLDELSKATLGSYVKKASKDSATSHRLARNFDHKKGKVAKDIATKFRGMAHKRAGNVDKAVDKLMAK